MKIPNSKTLSFRLLFAADNLQAVAEGLRANLRTLKHLPQTPELLNNSEQLDKIADRCRRAALTLEPTQ